jgi:hypothetical protein
MATDRHPEQDPAEGSRKVIERELAEQGRAGKGSGGEREAAEPRPSGRRDGGAKPKRSR